MFTTATWTGKGARRVNEDALDFLVEDNRGCWALADGLGGHFGGEIASGLAVEAILECYRTDMACTAASVLAHLRAANQAIVERQRIARELSVMRSTGVVMVACESSCVWGHAGDSRLYHFRGQRLLSCTKDHSVSQVLADSGEIKPHELRNHEDRNSLLRALGSADPDFKADVSGVVHTQPGDAFLLCTDGWWEPVFEEQMEADLRASQTPREWLERMQLRIEQAADAEQDNYSAIAVWRRE